MTDTLRILGIDPGSRITGYGIVELTAGKTQYLASGHLKVDRGELPSRLQAIFAQLSEVISTHQPTVMAVEQVFMAKNADSALKLGQARGAAICAGTAQGLAVSEYTARQVKQAIVGTGAADKVQVQHMVKTLLGLRALPQADEADALAVALCHASAQDTLSRMGVAANFGRGRYR